MFVLALASVSFAAAGQNPSGVSAKADPLAAVSQDLSSLVSGAKLVGRLPAATVLSASVSIVPRDRATLTAYANSVSDPKSSNYHRFLSPTQIGERFGASASTVNATVNYLKSKGMTVTMIGSNRMVVLFKGRADKFETAFGTKLNRYSVTSRPTPGPLTFFSNATAIKVPSSLSKQVVAVQGLDNVNAPVGRSTLRPQDTRNVYNVNNLYAGGGTSAGHKGEGVNIAISNFDGYRLSFLDAFYSNYNLPTPPGGIRSNVRKVIVNGVDGETQTPGIEGDLDIQCVLAMAPRCNLYIYDGMGGSPVSTFARMAEDNIVDIVTESYGFGGGDAFYLAAHDQHLAMTAQGITYMCASGDNGTRDMNSDLPGFLGVPYPNMDPEVLMIGGTDVTLDGTGNRGTEVGWDGSGSGWYPPSLAFNVLPAYQVGNGVPTGINKRLNPDISLHAAPTDGYFISFNGSFIGIGGTSAASPTFAGQLGLILQTLKEQNAADPASNGRPRLGRIQDFLYQTGTSAGALIDILGGDAGILPDGTESVGKPGWDFVTGLGAPDVDAMYNEFLTLSSVPVEARAVSAAVFNGYGTNPTGTATDPNTGVVDSLAATEGNTASITTVKQSGLGQVGAATIDVKLSRADRRSASLRVTMTSPRLTTGYVYLYNFATGAFDQAQSNVIVVTGSGSAQTVTKPIDLSANYIDPATQTVRLLVRAIKPARLGSAPFTLTVDEATVIERVPRSQ